MGHESASHGLDATDLNKSPTAEGIINRLDAKDLHSAFSAFGR